MAIRKGLKPKLEQEITVSERQHKAAILYRQGLSMAKVAKELGISSETVHRDLHGLVEQWKHESQDAINEWRQEHIRRTEEMFIALQEKIAEGNTWAVNSALAVLERQAKLLGLDAPEKSAVASLNKVQIEYVETDNPLND